MPKYNGYENWETWNAALHLDNDYGSYTYWREYVEDGGFGTRDEAVASVASALEEEFDEAAERAGLTGLLSDFLTSSLNAVDWREVADSVVDEDFVGDDEEDEEV